MKKTLLSVFMLCGFGLHVSHAQITINDTHLIGINDNVEQARDTIPTGVTIGSAGASQTWNFSTVLDEDELDTLKFRDPLGFPGFANFPLANMVMWDTGEDSSWNYLRLNPAVLQVVGNAQWQQGNLITIPLTTTILTFPSTMGTSFNGTWNGDLFGFDVSAFPLGLDSIKITRGATVTSNIDGWGTVMTPFATGGFPALRQIVLEEDIDTTWEKSTLTGQWSIISPTTIGVLAGFGIPITDIAFDTIRTARWWTDDPSAKFPVVEMDYEANGTVNSVDWQKSSPTVGIAEVNAAEGIDLYPNPAQNEINIESSLKNNSSISIVDVTGKLVKELKFTTSKVRISIADLENGVYFYNVYDANGNVLYSNKFVKTK